MRRKRLAAVSAVLILAACAAGGPVVSHEITYWNRL